MSGLAQGVDMTGQNVRQGAVVRIKVQFVDQSDDIFCSVVSNIHVLNFQGMMNGQAVKVPR